MSFQFTLEKHHTENSSREQYIKEALSIEPVI